MDVLSVSILCHVSLCFLDSCCLTQGQIEQIMFKYSITKAFCICLVMTFFSIFDVPVFWTILLVYWVLLFTLTMKRQILHMIKYKNVPFSLGKQQYDRKREPLTESASLTS
ncbi:hypothetical protein ACSBR1_010110 [Camellia fascicularis]